VSIFVDTSAFLALLGADDPHHEAAKAVWRDLIRRDETLFCTNYVLVETFALAQQRFGLAAVRTIQANYTPILRIAWLDAEGHNRAVMALLAAGRRQLSLVDCASFDAMHSLGLTTAFATDRHFREQGFKTLPR